MIFAATVKGIGTYLLFSRIGMGGGAFWLLMVMAVYIHILISLHIRWAMYM